MAEAGGLNPLQYGFESHRGHAQGSKLSPMNQGLEFGPIWCTVAADAPEG